MLTLNVPRFATSVHAWALSVDIANLYDTNSSVRFSPWENCPTNSCELTYSEKDSSKADAVLFHLHRMTKSDAAEISRWSHGNRDPKQIWIFLTDESPMHTIVRPEYDNLFNWSMTYRSDSDVWVPYGRTVRNNPFSKSNIGNHLQKFIDYPSKMPKKTKLVAIMGSNCAGSSGSNRWKYVQTLVDFFKETEQKLDIFGTCLGGNTTACPGHFTRDCPLLDNYKFYLAFENSNCREYLTEKIFWNAYSKFSVPVVMGAPREDCKRLLPPHSFIHVEDFASVESLFDYLRYLDTNDGEYQTYHAWRSEWRIVNEHAYFGTGSMHYCRLCESLWLNRYKKKYYQKLSDYWSKNDCVISSHNISRLWGGRKS